MIRYLREELPASVRPHVRFDVLCGSSVGAVTACFLASTADQPDTQGAELAKLWTSLSLEQVYKVQGEDLWTLTQKVWRLARAEKPDGWRLYDLLHLAPIEELVRTHINWPRIAGNLARGAVNAISVSTTRIHDGHTVVFVQRRDGTVPPWSRDPSTEARSVVLGAEHALASAAIPLLFRAVKIGGEYFCDGSVRQNTPLSPALRLGAERVLVLSLRRANAPVAAPRESSYPSTPALMGKVLNALMLDHTDYDLDRLRRFNAIFETATQTFGPTFLERLNHTVTEMRGQPYRMVKDLVLRPSRDLSALAASHAKAKALTSDRSPIPTRLLRSITRSNLFTQADLASLLLFDRDYSKQLIELAMEDTHAQRDALIQFFQPSA